MPQLKIDNDLKLKLISDIEVPVTEPAMIRLLGMLGELYDDVPLIELHYDKNGPPSGGYSYSCKAVDLRWWRENLFIDGGDVRITLNVTDQWKIVEAGYIHCVREVLIELTIRFGMTSLDVHWD